MTLKNTHIFPEEIVLQGAAWLQPHPLLRVLVGQKQAILCGGSQALDLTQLVAQCSAGVQHRCLNEDTKLYYCGNR